MKMLDFLKDIFISYEYLMKELFELLFEVEFRELCKEVRKWKESINSFTSWLVLNKYKKEWRIMRKRE